MGTWNISLINGTTTAGTYVGVAQAAPWLFPLLLTFEFMVIFIAGLNIQSKRLGFSNVPMWGSIAGMVTTTTAIIWSGVTTVINGTEVGLIALSTLGVWIAVTLTFIGWFLIFTDME